MESIVNNKFLNKEYLTPEELTSYCLYLIENNFEDLEVIDKEDYLLINYLGIDLIRVYNHKIFTIDNNNLDSEELIGLMKEKGFFSRKFIQGEYFPLTREFIQDKEFDMQFFVKNESHETVQFLINQKNNNPITAYAYKDFQTKSSKLNVYNVYININDDDSFIDVEHSFVKEKNKNSLTTMTSAVAAIAISLITINTALADDNLQPYNPYSDHIKIIQDNIQDNTRINGEEAELNLKRAGFKTFRDLLNKSTNLEEKLEKKAKEYEKSINRKISGEESDKSKNFKIKDKNKSGGEFVQKESNEKKRFKSSINITRARASASADIEIAEIKAEIDAFRSNVVKISAQKDLKFKLGELGINVKARSQYLSGDKTFNSSIESDLSENMNVKFERNDQLIDNTSPEYRIKLGIAFDF